MRRTKISLAIAALAASSLSMAHADVGYRVTDIGSFDGALHTVARDINNQGHIVGQLADLREQNIRFELLDPADFPFLGEDADMTNLTEQEQLRVRNALINGTLIGGNPKFQKIAIELGYLFQGSNLTEVDGFDVLDEETGLRTDSVDLRLRAINDHGIMVGQSALPFYWTEGTDLEGEEARFHVRDGFPVAAWSDGVDFKLVGTDPDKIFGGVSGFTDINNNNVAVGFGTFIDGVRLEQIYEQCTTDTDEDGEAINLEPLAACLYRFWYNNSSRIGVNIPITEQRAFVWELSATGDVEAYRALGIAFDPEEDAESRFQTIRYTSTANAINDNGIIVGSSLRQLEQGALTRATLFTDEGPVKGFADDSPYRDVSAFIDVNNANIAVGSATAFTFGVQRQRLFYMDVSQGPSEAIFPEGLFADTNWTPRAINNNGQIVGSAALRGVQGIQARNVGFMYDINTNITHDLNSFLPCDSGYSIHEAVSINDNGEIVVSAVRAMDIEIDGESVTVNRLRTLKLTPDASEVGCQVETEGQVSRKGAALHPFWLAVFGFFSLIAIRRQKAKR
ncbi:MAG: DUF3466 family protein [Firmicutes bacterium]|nr:DUF3466 family protein [Bacillota bacterium]